MFHTLPKIYKATAVGFEETPAFGSSIMLRIYRIHLHNSVSATSRSPQTGEPYAIGAWGRIEASMEPFVSANHAPGIYRTNISGFAEAYIFRGLVDPWRVNTETAPLNGILTEAFNKQDRSAEGPADGKKSRSHIRKDK